MIDIGYFSLCLALVAAGYATFGALAGVQRQNLQLIRSAENGVLAVAGLLTIAVSGVWYALLTHDFSVAYVFENSNLAMPLPYVVAALWGGQSGSLLFWGWLLSLYGAAVIAVNRQRYRQLMPYVVAVMGASTFFFVLLNLFAADPFIRLPIVPPDGTGLNPLLQHPYMAIHPPMLYMGMVGMVVPFAFGIAALMSGRLDNTWLSAARRWMLIPWTFLGAGLLLGGKWAYVELGWGGYWAWDPVENASFMPWLAGTAFLHSIMIQERRSMLKVWNVVLVTLTYGLCIFGTFLTRSGVVDSVHAFARSNVGPFLMTYLVVILLVSGSLILWRLKALKAQTRLESFTSRETAFLLNNWILLGMVFAVFWGTLFPVMSEAFTGEKITVSAPFFNKINIPIGLVLLFLTGAGPLFAWRHTSSQSLKRNFARPLLLGAVVAAVAAALGAQDGYAIITFGLSAFVVAATASEFHRGVRARRRGNEEGYLSALYHLMSKGRRRYGGYLVHLAMILLFIGFSGQAFTKEREFVLEYGESLQIEDYTFTYQALAASEDANKTAVAAALSLFHKNTFLATLVPQRHIYKAGEQEGTTEVSVYSQLREDIYLVLVGWSPEDNSAKFQLYINPLVNCVWAGGILFVVGALWSMWPTARDRRSAARDRASFQAAITPAPPLSQSREIV